MEKKEQNTSDMHFDSITIDDHDNFLSHNNISLLYRPTVRNCSPTSVLNEKSINRLLLLYFLFDKLRNRNEY